MEEPINKREMEEHSRFPVDPSELTTQMVWREIGALKELLQARVSEVEKGIMIAHDDLVRVPTAVQSAVGGVQLLMETKINYENKLVALSISHVEKQFSWIEAVRIEQKRDTATAVDAALKAAKEAVTEQNSSNILANTKLEIATYKQIDQLALLVNTGIRNLDDKISDVKDRFNVSDSSSKGKDIGKAQLIAMIVGAATVIGIIGGLIAKFM